MSQLEQTWSLLGVMTAEEARSHLEEIAGPQAYPAEESLNLWRTSREAYKPVHDAPGLPNVREFPPSTWDYLLGLPKHESFAAMVGGFRWSARLVEIDALLSVAIDVYVRRVEEWVERLCGADPAGILKACLPGRAAPLPVIATPQGACVVHSDLGATWICGPQKGLGPTVVQPPLAVRAAEIAGQLYLVDGYHRAVALRRLGQHYIPSLILHDCNWSFLRTTPRLRRFEPSPFGRPNPPCVGHFLTPAAVTTRAFRQIRIMTMRIDSFIVPLVHVPEREKASAGSE